MFVAHDVNELLNHPDPDQAGLSHAQRPVHDAWNASLGPGIQFPCTRPPAHAPFILPHFGNAEPGSTFSINPKQVKYEYAVVPIRYIPNEGASS